MPRFPIVDSHVHFWAPKERAYPWLRDVPALNGRRTPAELDAAAGAVELAQIVFVQCGCADAAEEVRWVEALAERDVRIAGIVAHAPLESGDAVGAELERLAARPRVKGVRRLGRLGLVCDLCIYHRQLSAVVELVRACPEVSFVLDHAGKPGIRAGLTEPWRTQLTELARSENVVCKLSGLATEADHATWTEAQVRPYAAHVLDCFGAGRVLFGSDWPVSTLATGYERWVAAVDAWTAGCSEAERRAIFAENARRIYRLP
jgi:L-fuconolactonase